MSSVLEKVGTFFDKLQQHQTDMPLWHEMPPSRIFPQTNMGAELKPNESYFELRINQLYLPYDRQWFSTYEPTVLATSGFSYGDSEAGLPFLVSPSLIDTGKPTPLGTVLSDTLIAGPAPYRGDGLTLAVILYASQKDNYLRKLLDVLGKTAGALDLSGSLQIYAKIANVVVDGIDELTPSLRAVLAYRKQFRPVKAGYFALIGTTGVKIDPNQLWVVNGQLLYGVDREKAQAFQSAEYVLYSINAVNRENFQNLPIFPVYREALRLATNARSHDTWEDAKLKMAEMIWAIQDSPDLTESDKEKLSTEWQAKIVALHKAAVDRTNLGAPEQAVSTALELLQQKQRARRLSVMKL
jgi:hypothetical protein